MLTAGISILYLAQSAIIATCNIGLSPAENKAWSGFGADNKEIIANYVNDNKYSAARNYLSIIEKNALKDGDFETIELSLNYAKNLNPKIDEKSISTELRFLNNNSFLYSFSVIYIYLDQIIDLPESSYKALSNYIDTNPHYRSFYDKAINSTNDNEFNITDLTDYFYYFNTDSYNTYNIIAASENPSLKSSYIIKADSILSERETYYLLVDPSINEFPIPLAIHNSIILFPSDFNSTRLTAAYMSFSKYKDDRAPQDLQQALGYSLKAYKGLSTCDNQVRALAANLVAKIYLTAAESEWPDSLPGGSQRSAWEAAWRWSTKAADLIDFEDHKVLYTAAIQTACQADLAMEQDGDPGARGACWRADLIAPVKDQDWLPASFRQLEKASVCEDTD